MNEYFQTGSVPAPSAPGSSATIRGEFASIAAAFDKLPVMASSPNEFVVVNATGTALISAGFAAADLATINTVQTLTNKTLSWDDNTWPGFGTGATKDAGTGADEVLLLAAANKLPALDGSALTNLNPAAISVLPLSHGGTGATDLAGAQASLGIDLKADANNAVLTGAPTCPTPAVGDTSARIVNAQFVTQTVAAVGGATPSNNVPLINGVAGSGAGAQVSRDDHVHPVDTSRAAAAAATAAGTSFTPAGTIAAASVQAAIAELDSETQTALGLKAPLASPAFTGNPTAPTPLTSDNDTSIATTAFVQSLVAQQPAGAQVSNSAPLMNGVVAPGTGVEASRYDHVHPVDTSRATTAAVALKANIASPTFTGTVAGITKAMVGLGNVDNTSDANKPVSTAQQVALDLKIDTSEIGATVQAYDVNTAKLNVAQTRTAVETMTPTTASSASFTWATNTNPNVTVTTTGNLTMNAPTGATVGAFYFLEIVYGGAHTVTWNSNFKGVTGLTLTSSTAARDAFMFRAQTTSILELVGVRANVGA